jgi:hypothetical protein
MAVPTAQLLAEVEASRIPVAALRGDLGIARGSGNEGVTFGYSFRNE